MLTKEQIKSAIFENKMPSKTVRPFRGMDWTVAFCIVEKDTPDTLEDSVRILSEAIVIPKKTVEEKALFLNSLSAGVIGVLFDKYVDFYQEWIRSLNGIVKDIVEEDKQSKFEWEISKSVGIVKILHTEEYNSAQMLWIFYNMIREKRDKNDYVVKLIESIFDMLKPWLDKELYVQMEQADTDTRENVLFEEKTKEYLEEIGDSVEEENF
jgi:hypothetical protein